MSYTLIGLYKINDEKSLSMYKEKVENTIRLHNGHIANRYSVTSMFWDELSIGQPDGVVHIVFDSEQDAREWETSDSYQELIQVRNQAMTITLLGVKV